jgi:hypothetical protein
MKTVNYPPIQQNFINQFDGSLLNALKFNDLHIVLNPLFSEQYLIEELGDNERETRTTYHTTGETICLTASDDQRSNAIKLAVELKRFLKSYNPVKLGDIVKSHPELKKYNSKIDRAKKLAVFFINGEMFVCKGLKIEY